MKDIREADAGHATQRDLPYPGTTPEFERLIAELRAEVHALREMVQPLHDARVAEMKRQQAKRERQRVCRRIPPRLRAKPLPIYPSPRGSVGNETPVAGYLCHTAPLRWRREGSPALGQRPWPFERDEQGIFQDK
jgi:hypothetical protein